MPQEIEATAVANPPSDASELAPKSVFNENVYKAIRNPSERVRQASAVDKAAVDSRKTSKPDGPNEESVILYSIGMRRFVAA